MLRFLDISSLLPDDWFVTGVGKYSSFVDEPEWDYRQSDPDPICTFFHNCPKVAGGGAYVNRAREGIIDSEGKDENDVEDGSAMADEPKDEPEDEDMVTEIETCDPHGRLEMAGDKVGDNQHVKCNDPYGRGYNICVSVLPADFAARTKGFCYSSMLNNAASSHWFFDNVRRWQFYTGGITKTGLPSAPKMRSKKSNRGRTADKLEMGLADVYEVQDTKGRWFPVTLLGQRGKTNLFEGILYDKHKLPLSHTGKIAPGNIRAYGGGQARIDLRDRVMLSRLGVQRGYGSLKVNDVGFVKSIQGDTITVVDDRHVEANYLRSSLMHAGLHEDQLARMEHVQIGSEYIWNDCTSSAGCVQRPATVKYRHEKGTYAGTYALEWFSPQTEHWHPVPSVGKDSLFLVPGFDTGKCMNVCKQHTGMPYCITSRALSEYLEHPHNRHQAAIEIDCEATKDRRKRNHEKGSNCARWLRTMKPNRFFRVGLDQTWRDDAYIDWLGAVPADKRAS